MQKLVAAEEGINPPIPTHTILDGIRKICIHFIMHVLIWNVDGKYAFCLATRVVPGLS